jgi:hypothetical protein
VSSPQPLPAFPAAAWWRSRPSRSSRDRSSKWRQSADCSDSTATAALICRFTLPARAHDQAQSGPRSRWLGRSGQRSALAQFVQGVEPAGQRSENPSIQRSEQIRF